MRVIGVRDTCLEIIDLNDCAITLNFEPWTLNFK